MENEQRESADVKPSVVATKGKTITDQVTMFHRAFGFPVQEQVTEDVDGQEIRLRARLVVEEVFEMLEALGVDPLMLEEMEHTTMALVDETILQPVDMVKLADALADIDFVVEGTRLTFGIPRQPIADAVAATNLEKAGGEVDATGKLQKPKGWRPPDAMIEKALQVAGWLKDQVWR